MIRWVPLVSGCPPASAVFARPHALAGVCKRWGRQRIQSSRLVAACAFLLLAGTGPVVAQIRYDVVEGAEDKKTLLLRDFKPQPMLHTDVHHVLQARFPVIDVHNHVNDAMGVNPDHLPPAKVVEVMDRCNIKTICILTGMWGEKLQRVIDEMVKPYPGRFMARARCSRESWLPGTT